tara:strand:- start:2057 stop:2230 length:174 start_codon:yes stop_codon:yes gene_type:complete
MKDLENFGVQELNANETAIIGGGGILRDIGYAVGYTLGTLAAMTIYATAEAIKILGD